MEQAGLSGCLSLQTGLITFIRTSEEDQGEQCTEGHEGILTCAL